MELTVTHHYESRLSPIERATVEVLNDRYCRTTTRRLHTTRDYSIELATLSPAPRHTTDIAWRWLAAGLVSLLALAGLIYYSVNGGGGISPAGIGAIVLLLAPALLFFYLFATLSARRVIFYGRFSGVPLVAAHFPLRDRRQEKAFAETLSTLAQKNRARLHHTDDDLRAGELRMLRRLSEKGAITRGDYDKAKAVLLRPAS